MSLIVFQQNTTTPQYRRVFFPAKASADGSPFSTSLAGMHALVMKGGLASFATYPITGATTANPVNVTAVGCATLLKSGDKVLIASVGGMTQINAWFTVGTVTTDHFTLQDLTGANVDGTGFTAYSSGGTVDQYWRQSANTFQQSDEDFYSLDLALPGTLDVTDMGETDAFGRGKVRFKYSGLLTIEEEFDVVNYDPHAAGASASDVATSVGEIEIETGVNLVQSQKYIAAATAGKAHGFPSAPVMDAIGNDGTARITATVDGAGNRTNTLT